MRLPHSHFIFLLAPVYQSLEFRTQGARGDGWSAWQPFSFRAQATGAAVTELSFQSGPGHCIAVDNVRIVDAVEPFTPLPTDAGHPYFTLLAEGDTYDKQKAACESRNLTLAVITSEAENAAANAVCQTTCYIGLSRPAGSQLRSDWTWVDGTEVGYTNWFDADGGDTGETRGAIRRDDNGQWHDWGTGDTLLSALCRGTYDYAAWAGGWKITFLDFTSVYRIALDGLVVGSHCSSSDCGQGQLELQPDGRYLLSGHLANGFKEFLTLEGDELKLTR
jgi:hypothetical protein